MPPAWYTGEGPYAVGPGSALSLYDVEIEQGAHGPVIALKGEIDLAAVEAVDHDLRPALDPPPPLLVLDLREVEFLDSSGLRLVLRLDREQRERGTRLVVVRGGRRVARVMELTGADRQLEMVDDPAEIQPEG
jgi:anti-anti-sigma factor